MRLPLRALREHRRSSGSIPSSVPETQDQRECPSNPFNPVGSASKEDGSSAPLLPRPRRLMRSIVLAHDDFPDPFVGKFYFPAGHRGFPWHSFDRETDAALLDAPEEITFLEHGDRRWIGEVCRGRIESPGRRTLAIEVSTVTWGTERGIEALPLLDGIRCL